MAEAQAASPGDAWRVDKLTIFTFMWACQAMVHHEFYHEWLSLSDPFGWLVLGFSVAVLLLPRSLALLMCLLLSSCIYNFLKWPFVVNHILAETIINVTYCAQLVQAR